MTSIIDRLNQEGGDIALSHAVIKEVPAVDEVGIHENIMPIEDDLVYAAIVPDVTDIKIKAGVDAFYLDYKLPETTLFNHVEIWYEARETDTGFDITNATKIYEGIASAFTYGTLDAEMNLYHKFWMVSVGKAIDSQKGRWGD